MFYPIVIKLLHLAVILRGTAALRVPRPRDAAEISSQPPVMPATCPPLLFRSKNSINGHCPYRDPNNFRWDPLFSGLFSFLQSVNNGWRKTRLWTPY